MPLNEQQQFVAQAGRASPIKVIAGAGTGKTETLAARFVDLVRQGLTPDSILLLTFTEEAAAEMRLRVMRRLAEAALVLPEHALSELWCLTFHGFAMRLIRAYGWALGLPPEPDVLDDDEQQAIVDEMIAAWEDALGDGSYAPFDHERYGWDNGEAWNRARTVLQSLRGSGATPAELDPHPTLREQQETLFGLERAQLVPLIAHAHADYGSRLDRAGLLDHDEQIARVSRLLECIPAITERFAVVMVDEFQDTNRAQIDLLRLLCPDWSRVTVVGDPRQAIYGWRAARPDSLRHFPYAPDREFHGYALRQNYRSKSAICNIANLALLRSEFATEEPLEATRTEFEDAMPSGADVGLYLLPAVADEADYVASEMSGLIQGGVAPRQIALLLRSRTHLPIFTAALHEAGVPFKVGGGSGFFRQPAVRLIASLLRLLDDPEDRNAAAHVIESPLVGLDLNLLRRPAAPIDAEHTWWRWLDDPTGVPLELTNQARVVARLSQYARFAVEARARMLVLPPEEFLPWVVGASGLYGWWRAAGDMQALRDIDKLVNIVVDWRRKEPGLTVSGYAALLRKRVEEQPREAIPVEHAVDAVEITTVHNAKGREWPVVFVADTGLPSTRAQQVEHVLWDEQWKLVISDGQARNKRGAADPTTDLRKDLRRRARNEERAIWYVALTRARDRLIVTHSRCQLDEHGHFDDARAQSASDTDSDKAVHFFHELWELVRADRERLGASVLSGPGPCLGMPADPRTTNPHQPTTVSAPISPYLQAAWEHAFKEEER